MEPILDGSCSRTFLQKMAAFPDRNQQKVHDHFCYDTLCLDVVSCKVLDTGGKEKYQIGKKCKYIITQTVVVEMLFAYGRLKLSINILNQFCTFTSNFLFNWEINFSFSIWSTILVNYLYIIYEFKLSPF